MFSKICSADLFVESHWSLCANNCTLCCPLSHWESQKNLLNRNQNLSLSHSLSLSSLSLTSLCFSVSTTRQLTHSLPSLSVSPLPPHSLSHCLYFSLWVDIKQPGQQHTAVSSKTTPSTVLRWSNADNPNQGQGGIKI